MLGTPSGKTASSQRQVEIEILKWELTLLINTCEEIKKIIQGYSSLSGSDIPDNIWAITIGSARKTIQEANLILNGQIIPSVSDIFYKNWDGQSKTKKSENGR